MVTSSEVDISTFVGLRDYRTVRVESRNCPVLFVGPNSQVVLGYRPGDRWRLRFLVGGSAELQLEQTSRPLYCAWNSTGDKALVGDGSTCTLLSWPSGRRLRAMDDVGLAYFSAKGNVKTTPSDVPIALRQVVLPVGRDRVILERPKGRYWCAFYSLANGRRTTIAEISEFAFIPALVVRARPCPMVMLVERAIERYRYWSLDSSTGVPRAIELQPAAFPLRWFYYPPNQFLRYALAQEFRENADPRSFIYDLQTKRKGYTSAGLRQVLTDDSGRVRGLVFERSSADPNTGVAEYFIWVLRHDIVLSARERKGQMDELSVMLPLPHWASGRTRCFEGECAC